MAITQSASLMALGLYGDRGMARHTSVPALGAHVEYKFGRPKYMVKGTESQLRPVKDKVRAAVKKRRLRLEEFFQPFDVTKTKKVSEASFVRAMDASGISLTRDELGLVINRYKIPGGGGAINYQKFCDQSNKVFTVKGLERNPGKNLVRSLDHVPPVILGAANPNLTPMEKARTAEMLEYMRRNVRDASLVVKNLFNRYDRHVTGCVSGEQFLRVVNCHTLLSADKILNMERYGHVLIKAFTERVDGPGLEATVVNYKALHDQLMEEDSWENCVVEPRPALLVDTHPEEFNLPDVDETEGERLERSFVEEAVARRVEVVDYFRAIAGGDATGGKLPGSAVVGLFSREKFKQLLKGLWRTHFTDEQVESLARRYSPSVDSCPLQAAGTVDLAAFARCVCKRVLDARKNATVAGGTRTGLGGGGVVAPPRLSEKEAKDVGDVILDIKGRIARERISLKPAFKNFDSRNELVVTNEQFIRVLSTEELLPVDARLRELLTRRYVVSDFRRHTTIHQGFVAYLDFLRDVDAPIEMETHAYIDNFVFGRDPNIKSPSDKGTAGDKGDAPTPMVAECVGLKSAASLTSEALMGRGGVGCNPARDSTAVLRDVRRRTARERVRIMDLFKDFDRIGHGTCTQAQLGRVMKTLDHALTDRELEAICQRYQSNVPGQCSPGDGTPLIVYKNFVSDIEAVFTVEGLEKKPCTTRVVETVREARGTERRLKGESSRVEKLTPEEERMLAKFLRELAMKVNKESLSLPSLFMDYDHFNAGDITEAGMERALGGACLLPPEPIFRAIVKKFREHSRRSSGGEVNYKAFLAAVELAQDPLRTPRDLPNATKFRAMREEGAADQTTPSVARTLDDPGKMTPRTHSATLQSALISVGFQLNRCHCQLEDFLAHEDALKMGEVTSAAMRHSLVLAGVRLTTPELVALDRSFRSMARPELIAWKELCKAAVETARGTTSGTDRNGDNASSARKTPLCWKKEELLIKLDGEIKSRNPNLEALFRVCDRSNRGTVTEAQFFSLLDQGLPRIHLTNAETDTLARLFVDRTGCDFGGRVRYKQFMEAVGA